MAQKYSMPVLLPYDGSGAARAALRHLADRARGGWARGCLILILPLGSRCTALRRRGEVRGVAGSAVALTFAPLTADDVSAALAGLARRWPGATFAAPLDLRGVSSWFYAIACAALTGGHGRCVALALGDGPARGQPPAPFWCTTRLAAPQLPGHTVRTQRRRCGQGALPCPSSCRRSRTP